MTDRERTANRRQDWADSKTGFCVSCFHGTGAERNMCAIKICLAATLGRRCVGPDANSAHYFLAPRDAHNKNKIQAIYIPLSIDETFRVLAVATQSSASASKTRSIEAVMMGGARRSPHSHRVSVHDTRKRNTSLAAPSRSSLQREVLPHHAARSPWRHQILRSRVHKRRPDEIPPWKQNLCRKDTPPEGGCR